jgi:hypothetical protein
MSDFDDHEFEELLRREGPRYRPAPPAPLDEMWKHIEAAHFGTEMRVQPARVRRWPVWLAAAASVLLGVAIGRGTAPTRTVVVTKYAPAFPAVASTVAPGPMTSLERGATARVENTRTTSTPRRFATALTVTADTMSVMTGADPIASRVTFDARGNAFEATTSRYLEQTSALLVALPAQLQAGRADQRFVAQAGELLSTTRLLLDSHAAAGTDVRRLLEDLELVLAQIARLPAKRGAEELDLITRALEERDVVPRLRSAAAEISTLEY